MMNTDYNTGSIAATRYVSMINKARAAGRNVTLDGSYSVSTYSPTAVPATLHQNGTIGISVKGRNGRTTTKWIKLGQPLLPVTIDGEPTPITKPLTGTSHANCTHEATKAARAKCRRANKA